MAWQKSQSNGKGSQLTHAPLFFAATQTPPPKLITGKLPPAIATPIPGREEFQDEDSVTTGVLLAIIGISLCSIVIRWAYKAARRSAQGSHMQDHLTRSLRHKQDRRRGEEQTNQTFMTATRRKRGLGIFVRDQAVPDTDASGVVQDAATEKAHKSVEENIQSYLAQKGGIGGRKLDITEAYARRKRREQSGYLVGY